MNYASGAAELAQNQFATAVRNPTPKLSAKFQNLPPFQDGISVLPGGAGVDASVEPTTQGVRQNCPATLQQQSEGAPNTQAEQFPRDQTRHPAR